MPDRFLSPESRTSGGRPRGSHSVLITVLIITLVFGIGAAAVVYFLVRPEKAANNTNDQGIVLNFNTSPNLNLTNNAGNLNTNANQNVNGLITNNSNTNLANTNTSTNANANGNANTNTNANQNNNRNTNSSTRTEPLPSTVDTDSDGLTDVEEQTFGTRANQPDSDGDSFIDGKRVAASGQIVGEVYLGYNPLGIGRLDTSGLIRSFSNTSFNYSIFYPTQWVAQAAQADGRSVLFTPANPTGETIQLMVEDNPTRLTARNYFLSVNPGVDPASLEAVVVNGLEGIRSSTGEDVYFAKNDKIYNIHYAIGQLTALNFMTTFEVMYQSFRLTTQVGT